MAEGPARRAAEFRDQREIVLGGRCGRQARRLAGLAGERLRVQHVEALVEKLRRVRPELAQVVIDRASPAEGGFARISR
jgi:hypothetical protein